MLVRLGGSSTGHIHKEPWSKKIHDKLIFYNLLRSLERKQKQLYRIWIGNPHPSQALPSDAQRGSAAAGALGRWAVSRRNIFSIKQ